ncbi:MAG: alkaline phosphatase family protein [Alphaproteobacteria bacterium]|nr:alkaline phosphatase family protein [Alphaproteobacteria bacterium]MDP6516727.1 alkaline phosphatase family protein [Alphaproteobacteria bacterium]
MTPAVAAIRNVLFIIADQWRGDTLGVLGHPCVRTPNLDRLAAEGVLFRHHFAQASPCGPARASILTGLYMFNHRQVANETPLDAALPNVAQAVRGAGFEPALFGYTDTPLDPRADGGPNWICPGFEPVAPFLFSDGFAGWRAFLETNGYTLPADPRALFLPAGGLDPADAAAPSLYRAAHSDTAYLADAALEYMTAGADKGWFVHFCCLRPHPPMVAPEPYNRLHDPAGAPPPRRPASSADIRGQHPWMDWLLDRQRLTEYFRKPVATDAVSETDDKRMRATYWGNCAEVDHQIGRLFAYLRKTGCWDETLILFCSDHGDQLGDNWLYGRRGYFDGHFHVPCIIHDPRPEADAGRGTVIDQFTESIDLLPTILDALAVTPEHSTDGRSLIPFLHGESPPDWRTEAHWELDFRDLAHGEAERALGIDSHGCGLAVIRDRAFKYVHFAALEPVLFDLTEDPGETVNRAQDPAYARIVRDYAQKMLSWRMAHERAAIGSRRWNIHQL